MIIFSKDADQHHLKSLGPLNTIGANSLAGDVQHIGRFDYGTPETNISVGIWEATQGEFEMTYPFNEGMTILQGRVTITSAQGEERTLEAGDSLFAERGEKATWHIQGKRRNTGKNSSTSLMMSALMKWRHTPENFSFHLI